MDRIVETKRQEVAAAKKHRSIEEVQALAAKAAPPRDFLSAVKPPPKAGVALIAEIKKASPSAGLILPDFDPVNIARIYARHGAVALSVLTDETYFQGRLAYIARVKEAVSLPVLRKDFIVDEYQIYESRAAGADAVLLITEVLGADRTVELLRVAASLELAALVEVHADANLSALLEAIEKNGSGGAVNWILGINNRDLKVQRTNLETTERLAAMLPEGMPFVSESGIATREDVLRVARAGACAVLVGESLLRAGDIGAAVDSLLGI